MTVQSYLLERMPFTDPSFSMSIAKIGKKSLNTCPVFQLEILNLCRKTNYNEKSLSFVYFIARDALFYFILFHFILFYFILFFCKHPHC